MSPWQGAFEKFLALLNEWKHLAVFALEYIGVIMNQRSFSMLTEAEKRLIPPLVSSMIVGVNLRLLLLRVELIREGGTIMVYSYDVTAGEKGFLRVGEAIKVDRLVFVPGCFHHLVLRSQEYTTDNFIHWKLVGLVAMITTKAQRRDYSKTNGHNSVDTGLCVIQHWISLDMF